MSLIGNLLSRAPRSPETLSRIATMTLEVEEERYAEQAPLLAQLTPAFATLTGPLRPLAELTDADVADLVDLVDTHAVAGVGDWFGTSEHHAIVGIYARTVLAAATEPELDAAPARVAQLVHLMPADERAHGLRAAAGTQSWIRIMHLYADHHRS